MKTILSFFLLILSVSLFSQDIIMKKNGENINAQIINIGSLEVTYKNNEVPNSPNFSINKSEIFKIKFETGKEIQFGKFESIQEVKDSIVSKINKYGLDINDYYKTLRANFENNYLTLNPIRYSGKPTKNIEKWDLSRIVKIHKLSLRERNIAYINIVCYKIKNNTPEIEKLVIKINDHQAAQDILEAFKELEIMMKKDV